MFNFDSNTSEIFLYDDIGPAWMGMIDSSSVIAALKQMPTDAPVTLRINSAGGSVDEAIAIYNAIQRHDGTVNVAIDSIAASAASFIAMAGEKVFIADGGAIMIHSPWTLAMGNATELRKTADVLDLYEDRLFNAYMGRMGKKYKDKEVRQMLADETWFTASDAVEAGLADSVENIKAEPAVVAEGRYAKTPQMFLIKKEAGERTPYPHARERYKALAARKKLTR
jgi:ATP-dependent protease ClpP protease subunit